MIMKRLFLLMQKHGYYNGTSIMSASSGTIRLSFNTRKDGFGSRVDIQLFESNSAGAELAFVNRKEITYKLKSILPCRFSKFMELLDKAITHQEEQNGVDTVMEDLKTGEITINQAREKFNLPAIPEGDVKLAEPDHRILALQNWLQKTGFRVNVGN